MSIDQSAWSKMVNSFPYLFRAILFITTLSAHHVICWFSVGRRNLVFLIQPPFYIFMHTFDIWAGIELASLTSRFSTEHSSEISYQCFFFCIMFWHTTPNPCRFSAQSPISSIDAKVMLNKSNRIDIDLV